MAYNAGGDYFKFAEGMSQYVDCKTQDEIDYYWEKLGAGGEYQPCGWLRDKFGVSWQIIPSQLASLLSHPDPAKAQRVMEAMLEMSKMDIAALENA
jgi:predicted 3-demethylubiquinone-9 3-methyltransferase (glyoxalase superfamily)